MTELFTLAMPWWEFVLRAVVVYVVLLVLIRMSGKRTMGQFTPFDVLLIVLLGNAVQNALLGQGHLAGRRPAAGGDADRAELAVGVRHLAQPRVEALVEGVPVVLARDGKCSTDVLRRELVSQDDFDEALRQNGAMTLTTCAWRCWRPTAASAWCDATAMAATGGDTSSVPPITHRTAQAEQPAGGLGSPVRQPVARPQVVGQPRLGAAGSGTQPYSQRTSGGRHIRIDSVRPPVCRPNSVPRSYTRLNST